MHLENRHDIIECMHLENRHDIIECNVEIW